MRGSDRRVALGLYRSDLQRRLLETALTLGVTDLDTAYNYRGFTSHRRLAATAGDLLSEFTISTKVGFFPSSRGPEHSLDPVRLRQAVHESAQDLGAQPDVVLLHNPEQTLAELALESGRVGHGPRRSPRPRADPGRQREAGHMVWPGQARQVGNEPLRGPGDASRLG